jgi:PAS domain-containing protein
MLAVPRDPNLIAPACVRATIFEIVACVIIALTKRSETIGGAMREVQTQDSELLYKKQEELTKALKLEKAYREATEYYERIFAQLNAPMAIWNAEWYVTYANQRFEELTGRSTGEVIGRRILSIPPFDRLAELSGEGCQRVDFPIGPLDSRDMVWIFSGVRSTMQAEPIAVVAIGVEIPEDGESHE